MPSNCNVTLNPIIQPPMRPVVAIREGNPTAVTCGTVNGVGVVTTIPHYYVNGTIVRFDVPAVDGMPEINGMTGEVTVIDAVSFEVNIDSTKFTAFNIPLDADPTYNPHIATCALVVPIGENNAQLTAAVHNIYG